MVNAGRVLIIAKGEWSNLVNYEQLDLVSVGTVAYLARKASVGVNPSTDTQMEYWQPFGSVSDIATTEKPGLVMPDGTTISVDATGLIAATPGIENIKDVSIVSLANKQILKYNTATLKWENGSLTATEISYSNASMKATNVKGALDELKTDNQTLGGKIGNVTTKTLAANATSIQFDVPTSGDHLIDFFISDGSFYTAIDLSVTGKATLTFKASANSRSVSCRISNI